MFEENNFLEDLRTKGFSEELFHVFESYYLSVICSDYGLRKLFEFINTNNLNERKILNLLVALLKQYELGVLNKEALIKEINLSI
ncbi:hypothetical protein EZV73_19080 [Acidaminobacter sp. JC074]|uniref:hypothetical protein n=1 Tax=Acidaminobacter sp. JC074 TaxID=2530199 RepID=UPI001F0DF6B5|nr:hypothetical protein [Acidaminobacter sp. JC074]MCH4889694.1 hypothetical protein [Acidaminobacter sp. JC074]